MEWNQMFSKEKKPTMQEVEDFVNCPPWLDFNRFIQTAYRVEPVMEYSSCSLQPGWNIKYKKSGKALCTIYPMPGYFFVMVVIGNKEMQEAEFMMPSCRVYIQDLFQRTKMGNGQKWLMIEVRNDKLLNDIYGLIRLRKKPCN